MIKMNCCESHRFQNGPAVAGNIMIDEVKNINFVPRELVSSAIGVYELCDFLFSINQKFCNWEMFEITNTLPNVSEHLKVKENKHQKFQQEFYKNEYGLSCTEGDFLCNGVYNAVEEIFDNKSLTPEVKELYDNAESPPDLSNIDKLIFELPDNQKPHDFPKLSEEYSNPGYFMEHWIDTFKKEEAKEEKRRSNSFKNDKTRKGHNSFLRQTQSSIKRFITEGSCNLDDNCINKQLQQREMDFNKEYTKERDFQFVQCKEQNTHSSCSTNVSPVVQDSTFFKNIFSNPLDSEETKKQRQNVNKNSLSPQTFNEINLDASKQATESILCSEISEQKHPLDFPYGFNKIGESQKNLQRNTAQTVQSSEKLSTKQTEDSFFATDYEDVKKRQTSDKDRPAPEMKIQFDDLSMHNFVPKAPCVEFIQMNSEPKTAVSYAIERKNSSVRTKEEAKCTHISGVAINKSSSEAPISGNLRMQTMAAIKEGVKLRPAADRKIPEKQFPPKPPSLIADMIEVTKKLRMLINPNDESSSTSSDSFDE